MTEITQGQLSFLKKHSIPLSSVFDAVGLGPKNYRPLMKSLGKTLAIGVTPCKKSKHTMRLRTGTCIQCHTSGLSFLGRYEKPGTVYVAGSLSGEIIKIGLTDDPNERIATLNNTGYGGMTDWTLLYYAEVDNAGMVEFKSQKSLIEFSAPTTFVRQGNVVDCLETFSCGLPEAVSAVRSSAENIQHEWKLESSSYDFKILVGGKFVRKGGVTETGRATPIVVSPHISGHSETEHDPTKNNVIKLNVKHSENVKEDIKPDVEKEKELWDKFELSVRTSNCLRNAGIKSLGDITRLDESELLQVPNFARKCLREVKEVLSDFGLKLADKRPLVSLSNCLPSPTTEEDERGGSNQKYAWKRLFTRTVVSNNAILESGSEEERRSAASHLSAVLDGILRRDAEQIVLVGTKSKSNGEVTFTSAILENDIGEDANIEHVSLSMGYRLAIKMAVGDWLTSLTPLEELVLSTKFEFDGIDRVGKGKRTLSGSDLGRKIGLSTRAAKECSSLALRKLKHPSRSRKMRPILKILCDNFGKENQEGFWENSCGEEVLLSEVYGEPR
jgi:hypothetical protein